jgi:hypothetical protein
MPGTVWPVMYASAPARLPQSRREAAVPIISSISVLSAPRAARNLTVPCLWGLAAGRPSVR